MSELPLQQDSTLLRAVQAIESSRRRIAAVVDEAGRLIGTLTDGDVRRCLLSGGTLETLVVRAMNPRPLKAPESATDIELADLMQRGNVLAIPIVSRDDRFLRFVHVSDLRPGQFLDTDSGSFDCAVIMAGGEGQRLRPVTDRIPKPMVEIGGAPLLERQVRRLVSAGVKRIYLAVNYMAHVIEDHFEDGSRFSADIRYLRETEKLGTAGALALLPSVPNGTAVVMNGDILTNVDFAGLHSFHQSHSADITVAAIDYRVSIPFGVIESNGARLLSVLEKPSQRFLCNAGIYAVSAPAVSAVSSPRYLNMTDLIAHRLGQGQSICVFPMHEYWSDIGTPVDLERARRLFDERNRK